MVLNTAKIAISKRDIEADIVEGSTTAVAKRKKEKVKVTIIEVVICIMT
jgi:hypothetical protein